MVTLRRLLNRWNSGRARIALALVFVVAASMLFWKKHLLDE